MYETNPISEESGIRFQAFLSLFEDCINIYSIFGLTTAPTGACTLHLHVVTLQIHRDLYPFCETYNDGVQWFVKSSARVPDS